MLAGVAVMAPFLLVLRFCSASGAGAATGLAQAKISVLPWAAAFMLSGLFGGLARTKKTRSRR
jgi:hypothetical protein